MLQHGAVCCNVLLCVVVLWILYQGVVILYSKFISKLEYCSVVPYVAVCCSVLQCGTVCCSVVQCVAMCCSVLQCCRICTREW